MVSILLASASERRREILSNLVSESSRLTSRALATDELNPPGGIEVANQSELVCTAKAKSAAEEVVLSQERADYVIVADTLVENPTDPFISLGQPSDELSAASMLLGLSGRRHRVWSSTAILYSPSGDVRGTEILHGGWTANIWTDSAVVEFDELSEETLGILVSSGSWKGKAGGYDLAGMAGEHAILVEGEEVTVLGFSHRAIETIHSLIG
tara:strand:+ start:131 stop:766 length:636 start_codon:yes stop_codon:yes gene_type:complete